MRPALVAVAQGACDPDGPEVWEVPQVIAGLLDDVRRRLPGVDVITSWVEPMTPGVQEVMASMRQPAVLVPLLLSSGCHLSIDLPAATALSAAPTHVAPALGPDRHLARALTARLHESGALFGDAVVLAAGGFADPAGLADLERAAVLLRNEWGPRVTFACVSEVGPDVPAAVEEVRHTGAERVFVAPYVLAPGTFSRRVMELASVAGATTVAPVLGRHRLVTDLIVLRYHQGLEALAAKLNLAA